MDLGTETRLSRARPSPASYRQSKSVQMPTLKFYWRNMPPVNLSSKFNVKILSREFEERAKMMSRSLGIPLMLLHGSSGRVVSVELKTGEVYRGVMIDSENNWNCLLESVVYTARVSPRVRVSNFSSVSSSFFPLLIPSHCIQIWTILQKITPFPLFKL